MVVLAIGLGLGSIPQRWRIQALLELQMPILQTYLQIHSLHWPQLPYPRSLRHSGDIRLGWDLGPLLRCLRDDAGGLGLSSEPRHQDRGSLLDLNPSRHLLQLIRVRHLSYLQVLGSRDRCSVVIRFPGMSIFMPGNSMGSHITIY